MSNKKELKEQYKQMKFRMGIFQVRNKTTGKIYVASSINLDAIWNRHRTQLRFGAHPVKALQHDWNTYGEEQFSYEILSILEQKDEDTHDPKRELKELERMYLEELKPYGNRGYNRE
ncbi:GIY-YIG nuclease family protein [Filimonas effusa]|uniref:GIY-YIG nuclease family protein n=1 Tax=Filimonas effusa TaxID=2508721 RepID=A0A4Q1D5L9_9BACT|nr:GIY-YIG nuclease family protein [Filimonas effusa]RXK83759.1 GIY-YIG nuclease family protein [Filimonas effusa]